MNLVRAALLTRQLPFSVIEAADPFRATIEAIPGRVGWWRLGDTVDDVVAIDRVNGKHGLYQGDVVLQQPPLVANTTDASVLLNGTDAFIEITDDPVHHLASGTIFIAFKPSTLGVDRWIISKDAGGLVNGDLGFWYRAADNSLRFQLEDSSVIYRAQTSGGGFPTGVINAGGNHRAILSWGSQGMKLYVATGGTVTLVGTNNYTGGISANTNNWRLGASQFTGGAANFFAGNVDEPIIWNRQLTDAEIEAATQAEIGVAPVGEGIASGFILDSGIGAHPSVLVHENFESGSFAGDWTFTETTNSTIVTTAEYVQSGTRGWRIAIPGGSSTGGRLRYNTKGSIEYTKVHVRCYMKLPTNWAPVNGNNHVGFIIAGWGTGQMPGGAGEAANGTNKFGIWMQPNRTLPTPNRWMLYAYHMGNSGDFGDESIQTPVGFHAPVLGQWQCLEAMVQVNTVGQSNGLLRAWVDGVEVLNRENMQWRSTTAFAINNIEIHSYIHNITITHIIGKDDVVVATEYIGPQS